MGFTLIGWMINIGTSAGKLTSSRVRYPHRESWLSSDILCLFLSCLVEQAKNAHWHSEMPNNSLPIRRWIERGFNHCMDKEQCCHRSDWTGTISVRQIGSILCQDGCLIVKFGVFPLPSNISHSAQLQLPSSYSLQKLGPVASPGW